MPEKVMPGPISDDCRAREAVCVHTKKILDACRDKDCVEDLRVYLTKSSQCAVDRACSVKAGCAELLYVSTCVEPICFNKGFYTVDVRYFYRITADAFVGAARPVEVCGLAVFDKRVILFGSEGSSKTFSSDTSLDGLDCHDLPKANEPSAVVEAVIYPQPPQPLKQKNPLYNHTGAEAGFRPPLLPVFPTPRRASKRQQFGRIATAGLPLAPPYAHPSTSTQPPNRGGPLSPGIEILHLQGKNKAVRIL